MKGELLRRYAAGWRDLSGVGWSRGGLAGVVLGGVPLGGVGISCDLDDADPTGAVVRDTRMPDGSIQNGDRR